MCFPHLVTDGLDDLVPLGGVLRCLGPLQLLDDCGARADPNAIFSYQAILAHRIWGVKEGLLWRKYNDYHAAGIY